MPKSRLILLIGSIIALLPLLGFPHAWESFFQVLAGLGIVGLSVWTNIDRKLTLKAKAQMRQARKVDHPEVEAEGPSEEMAQLFGKRITDFYPKTGQVGRRASDFKATSTLPNNPEESLN